MRWPDRTTTGRTGRVLVYLGLGSNLGNREHNLLAAVTYLAKEMRVMRISSPYDTAPVGYKDQPRFLNAVVEVETMLEPEELLKKVKQIETDMGRIESFTDGPRLIDIDILLYSDVIMQTKDLTIPHPRYAQRAFVLAPLAELAPDMTCPLSGSRIKEMAGMVEGIEEVVQQQWTRR